ncbi:MAG: hypothetical protein RLZZ74_2308 [Cyanobacteriota bacterium]|jgi:hypothetical protein
MSRNKEEFDNWIKSMIEDLNSRSSGWYEVSSLEKWHWKKLWEIFDENIDINHSGSKEKSEAYDYAFDQGKSVILEAHDETDDDLQQEELMDHYMNSSSYD